MEEFEAMALPLFVFLMVTEVTASDLTGWCARVVSMEERPLKGSQLGDLFQSEACAKSVTSAWVARLQGRSPSSFQGPCPCRVNLSSLISLLGGMPKFYTFLVASQINWIFPSTSNSPLFAFMRYCPLLRSEEHFYPGHWI